MVYITPVLCDISRIFTHARCITVITNCEIPVICMVCYIESNSALLTALCFVFPYCTQMCCVMLCTTVLYSTVLYSTVLYCTVLYCVVLYCTVLYCTVLYCTILYCTVLHCTVLYCTVLYCTILYCTILYYTAQHCNKKVTHLERACGDVLYLHERVKF